MPTPRSINGTGRNATSPTVNGTIIRVKLPPRSIIQPNGDIPGAQKEIDAGMNSILSTYRGWAKDGRVGYNPAVYAWVTPTHWCFQLKFQTADTAIALQRRSAGDTMELAKNAREALEQAFRDWVTETYEKKIVGTLQGVHYVAARDS